MFFPSDVIHTRGHSVALPCLHHDTSPEQVLWLLRSAPLHAPAVHIFHTDNALRWISADRRSPHGPAPWRGTGGSTDETTSNANDQSGCRPPDAASSNQWCRQGTVRSGRRIPAISLPSVSTAKTKAGYASPQRWELEGPSEMGFRHSPGGERATSGVETVIRVSW